jgi:hypothetical protein
MKANIFYFSSNGNSLYAAGRIASGIGAGASAAVVEGGRGIDEAGADLVGIVFPVYLHKAPSIVRDFLARSRFAPDAYVFAVATHNGGPGFCMRGIDAALRRGGSSLSAGFGLLMPGNSVIIADLTNDPGERARRLAGAEAGITTIVRSVGARERNDFARSESLGSWLQSRTYALAASAYRVPRHFRARLPSRQCRGGRGWPFLGPRLLGLPWLLPCLSDEGYRPGLLHCGTPAVQASFGQAGPTPVSMTHLANRGVARSFLLPDIDFRQ